MTAACRRCGVCCRKGAPALHRKDVIPAARGVFPPGALITLRAGELAWDAVRAELLPLEEEVIKITGDQRGKAAGRCVFFDPGAGGCAVYDNRPEQCRALSCQDTSALAGVYARDRLRRADLLPLLHADWPALAEAHESECSWARLAPAALRAHRAPEARAALLEALRFDQAFRDLAVQRAGVPEGALRLLFGRPPAELLADFGLALALARAPGEARLVRSGLCRYPEIVIPIPNCRTQL